jgi:hypothetical protein
VALIPGERIERFENVYAWDVGAVRFDHDRLTFDGDVARFSVRREDVHSIEVGRGPLAWMRVHAVILRCATGTFSLRLAGKGTSRRLAKKLEAQVESWRRGESNEAVADAGVFPPPQLPTQAATTSPTRLAMAWIFLKTAILLFIGAGIVSTFVAPMMRSVAVPFGVAFLYLVTVGPAMFRKEPRATLARPEPTPAEGLPV